MTLVIKRLTVACIIVFTPSVTYVVIYSLVRITAHYRDRVRERERVGGSTFPTMKSL